MANNMKQWCANLAAAKKKKALPVLSFPCIQLLDIQVSTLISSSEMQANGMAAIAERFDTAASVSLMDLSVEAEAFGAPIRVTEGEVPTVAGRILTCPEDVGKLRIPAVGTARTGVYIDAVAQAKKKITDRPVFAGVIGPYSLAGRLMDMTELMMNCYEEPDMVHQTMRLCTDFIISYARAFKETGADGIIMAEPASGLLSPTLHREFSFPYVKEIIDAVTDDSFQIIYHNCGNTVPLLDDIFALGAGAYHFGNAVDMRQVLAKANPAVPVLGNVDPVSMFRYGTPDGVREATMNLLNDLSGNPGFVISSGCDIPPLSPLENIDAFFKAVSDFYQE